MCSGEIMVRVQHSLVGRLYTNGKNVVCLPKCLYTKTPERMDCGEGEPDSHWWAEGLFCQT